MLANQIVQRVSKDLQSTEETASAAVHRGEATGGRGKGARRLSFGLIRKLRTEQEATRTGLLALLLGARTLRTGLLAVLLGASSY